VKLDEISELPEAMNNAGERQNTLIRHGQLSLCPGFFPRLPNAVQSIPALNLKAV
jgi:hypothetical protein